MTTPRPRSTIQLLDQAIVSASKDRLQGILRDLVRGSPKAFDDTCRELLVLNHKNNHKDSPSLNQEQHEQLAGQKRKERDTGTAQLRWETCANCGDEYDITSNGESFCNYHTGALEVYWDGDFWADHDEDCHGKIDTDAMRKEYPEGFMWSCCYDMGDIDGCQSGAHQPKGIKRLRL